MINITITVFLIWDYNVDRITRILNLIGPSLPNNSYLIQKSHSKSREDSRRLIRSYTKTSQLSTMIVWTKVIAVEINVIYMIELIEEMFDEKI